MDIEWIIFRFVFCIIGLIITVRHFFNLLTEAD